MEMAKKDWLWIAGGFGIVLVIGGVVYYVSKPKKDTGTPDKNKTTGKKDTTKNTGADTGEAKIKVEGTTDPWDVNYYKDISAQTGGKVLILTKDSAMKLATRIYDAEGVFDDDEEDVYKVIGSLKNKAQLSYLAEQFQVKYGKDMREYIKGFLSADEEFPKVSRMVAALTSP
jgi:hypothetical protein